MKPRKKQKKLRITEADFLLANRRAARLEEIELHGKPVSFRKVLQQSKKVYSRKRLKKEMAAIRCLDTGHNLEGWPSDALKYNPNTV